MNGNTNGSELLILACIAFVKISKYLPPKVRLVSGSMVTALTAGTFIGSAFVSAIEPDIEIATNQAKIIVPVLSIIIFLVIYFVWRRYQEQQEKQLMRDQFNLARTLIEEHHYERARTILGAINDPKARDWETKLRRRTPDAPDFLQQFQ